MSEGRMSGRKEYVAMAPMEFWYKFFGRVNGCEEVEEFSKRKERIRRCYIASSQGTLRPGHRPVTFFEEMASVGHSAFYRPFLK